MMLVKYICYLIRLQNILCITICSKTCQDTSVNDLHGWRASAGITHVRLRVVYYHSISCLDQFHLMWVYIDAVAK